MLDKNSKTGHRGKLEALWGAPQCAGSGGVESKKEYLRT